VAVEVDGQPVARLRKPTPQRPWRETHVELAGEHMTVALIRHFPVMQTDLFRGGISIRDGRPIETVKADAPPPLSNYDAWVGACYRRPSPRTPGWARWLVGISLAVWFLGLAGSPYPEAARPLVAAALAVTGTFLTVVLAFSVAYVAERVHRLLVERPSLGDWRIALWFAGLLGYALLLFATVPVFVLVAASF
jgi:hypothetical protein